ncbi:hypothetical protein LTS12_029035, partial [Elasticomyces elasticus]
GQSPQSPVIPNQQISYPQPYGANAPYQQSASPVYQNFSPGPAHFTPSGYSPHPGQPYGTTPSPFPSQPQPQQPQNNSPQASGFPRSGSLPATPGLPVAPSLPQRPSFGAPQVNSFQLQQMHMGHVPPPGAEAAPPAEATSATPATPADDKPEEKTKKDKSKNTRLVYSDNEISPEEKMANLPRYAFAPIRMGETTAEAIPTAGMVAGTTRDSDNMNLDPTD